MTKLALLLLLVPLAPVLLGVIWIEEDQGASSMLLRMDFETNPCIDSGTGDVCTTVNSPDVNCTSAGDCPLEGSISANMTTTGEMIHDLTATEQTDGWVTLDFYFTITSHSGSNARAISIANATDDELCSAQFRAATAIRAQAHSGDTSGDAVISDGVIRYARLTYNIDTDYCEYRVSDATWGDDNKGGQNVTGSSSGTSAKGWLINGITNADLIFDDITFCDGNWADTEGRCDTL